MCQYHLRPSKKCFLKICFVSPGHLRTIQNLIPGRTTIVKLLKQVKNWKSPSRDPWSNCLINSREDDKGQSYYYSGRQKDNSKTICRCGGYNQFFDIYRCLFMRLHFSIGGYDHRRTARFRQGRPDLSSPATDFHGVEDDTKDGVLAIRFIKGLDFAVTRSSPESC